MKTLTVLTMVCMTLTACTARQIPTGPDAAATLTAEVGLPNPASVHCREMGNTLDIRTAADGSQQGVCVFPDGSECEEWAFFRGECGPAPTATAAPTSQPLDNGPATPEPESNTPPGTNEAVVDWWGIIAKTDAGAQFDDYFERQDLGQPIAFGIDSRDPAIEARIEALRDSGKIVHLYGTLFSSVPDVNGSQIVVDRLVVEE